MYLLIPRPGGRGRGFVAGHVLPDDGIAPIRRLSEALSQQRLNVLQTGRQRVSNTGNTHMRVIRIEYQCHSHIRVHTLSLAVGTYSRINEHADTHY
jgi:hypothetical protein